MGTNLPHNPERPRVTIFLDLETKLKAKAKAQKAGVSLLKWLENRVLQSLGKAPKWDEAA